LNVSRIFEHASAFPVRPAHTIGQDYVRLGAGRPVRVQLLDPHKEASPHDHVFHEIAFVLRGSIRHRWTDGEETLRAGDILVLTPRCVHAYDRARDCAIANLYYLADWFLGRPSALHVVPGLVPVFFGAALYHDPALPRRLTLDPQGPAFQRLRRELEDLLVAEREDRSALYHEAAFFKILDELTAALRAAAPDLALAGLPPEETQRGLRHLELLAARRQPFSATAAARAAGWSSAHFARRVGEATGLSPRAYFQRQRIHLVCRKLLAGSASVAEIAHEFGYADAAHLNRHFRAWRGLTPTEYRRRYA
jgi:AraC-like DNA-binding protein/quercetin dioxygenase-like cupin family protein